MQSSASPDGRAANGVRKPHLADRASHVRASVAAARHALGNPDVDSSGFVLPAHTSAPSTPDSGSVNGSSSRSETGSSSSTGAPESRASSDARRLGRAASPRGSPMSEAGRRRALDLLRAANAAAVASLRPPSPQRQRTPQQQLGLDASAPPPPPLQASATQHPAAAARAEPPPLHGHPPSRRSIGSASGPGSLSDEDSLSDDDAGASEARQALPQPARAATPSAHARLAETAAAQALVSWD